MSKEIDQKNTTENTSMENRFSCIFVGRDPMY